MTAGKTFTIVGDDLSDGYHTFDELYAHRIELYIALCRSRAKDPQYQDELIWRTLIHSDGSAWAGWFVLGIGLKPGEQITYHLPIGRWDDCAFAQTLERAPKWDGHIAADVLTRLKEL